MSMLFGFFNENKKRRANYKKPVVVLEGRRKLTFSGSYALPERIKLYKTIHKHVSEGALKTREYEKASAALGLRTITPVQIGFSLWLKSGGSHE